MSVWKSMGCSISYVLPLFDMVNTFSDNVKVVIYIEPRSTCYIMQGTSTIGI